MAPPTKEDQHRAVLIPDHAGQIDDSPTVAVQQSSEHGSGPDDHAEDEIEGGETVSDPYDPYSLEVNGDGEYIDALFPSRTPRQPVLDIESPEAVSYLSFAQQSMALGFRYDHSYYVDVARQVEGRGDWYRFRADQKRVEMMREQIRAHMTRRKIERCVVLTLG